MGEREQYIGSQPNVSEQQSGEKPVKRPNQTPEFIELAFAAGADAVLSERGRILIARAKSEPRTTLRKLTQELGLPIGLRSWSGVRYLLHNEIQMLWQASPPELQKRYPLNMLLQSPLGRTLTPEHRAKMSVARKGKPNSPESRAKMSESHKNSEAAKSHLREMHEIWRGMTHSPESRAKMSKTRKGKPKSPEQRAKIAEGTMKRWTPKERLQQAEEFTLYTKPPHSHRNSLSH